MKQWYLFWIAEVFVLVIQEMKLMGQRYVCVCVCLCVLCAMCCVLCVYACVCARGIEERERWTGDLPLDLSCTN